VLTFVPGTDGRFLFTRCSLFHTSHDQDPSNASQESHPIPPPSPSRQPPLYSLLLTLKEIGYGAVGIVYRAAEGCIVKLSQSPDKAEDLLNEAGIYRILQSSNASCFIPTLFGVFRHDRTVALVLSDEGRPITRFDELSLTDRYVQKDWSYLFAHYAVPG
jgi:hypothetical protein